MKNIAKADSPKSAMAILPQRRFRRSGKAAQTVQTRQKGWQQPPPYCESFFQQFGNPQNQARMLLLELLQELLLENF
jgi:hypothetical protein